MPDTLATAKIATWMFECHGATGLEESRGRTMKTNRPPIKSNRIAIHLRKVSIMSPHSAPGDRHSPLISNCQK